MMAQFLLQGMKSTSANSTTFANTSHLLQQLHLRNITGITKFSAYTLRHLLTNTLHDTSAQLIECQTYATGHTARGNYSSIAGS